MSPIASENRRVSSVASIVPSIGESADEEVLYPGFASDGEPAGDSESSGGACTAVDPPVTENEMEADFKVDGENLDGEEMEEES